MEYHLKCFQLKRLIDLVQTVLLFATNMNNSRANNQHI